MALKVVDDFNDKEAARDLAGRAGKINLRYRGAPDMGAYFIASNSNQPTLLATYGANTCQIILVHLRSGCGGLGHYSGQGSANEVYNGAVAMVRKAGGAPVDTILFAAGRPVGTKADQERYEKTILENTLRAYPSAKVTWHKPGKDKCVDSCIYLPLAEEVAFFGGSEVPTYDGDGGGNTGITKYDF
jgi:hypothetical protein